MSSNSSTVLLATCSVIAAGLGYGFYRSNSGTTDRSCNNLDEIDDDNAANVEDLITEEEVIKIFRTLYLEMQNVYAQLMKQIQAMAAMGQQLPQNQVQALFGSEMGRILVLKQKAICDQYNMDLECLEEATWEFLGVNTELKPRPEVVKVVNQFQKFWEHATGHEVNEWRPGVQPKKPNIMSPAETVRAAEVYFAAHREMHQRTVQRFRDEGEDLTNPVVKQRLTQEILASAESEDPGEAALDAMGCTTRDFEQSIQKNSSDPMVGQTVARLQMQQQQELQALLVQG